jgi:hypothetical protein
LRKNREKVNFKVISERKQRESVEEFGNELVKMVTAAIPDAKEETLIEQFVNGLIKQKVREHALEDTRARSSQKIAA